MVNHIFLYKKNISLCGLPKVQTGSLGQFSAEAGFNVLSKKQFVCKRCLRILKKREDKLENIVPEK